MSSAIAIIRGCDRQCNTATRVINVKGVVLPRRWLTAAVTVRYVHLALSSSRDLLATRQARWGKEKTPLECPFLSVQHVSMSATHAVAHIRGDQTNLGAKGTEAASRSSLVSQRAFALAQKRQRNASATTKSKRTLFRKMHKHT